MAIPNRPQRRRSKPSKPYPSFPLTAHNNGQWCKKIRGHVRFFGSWADPEAALTNYLHVAADLHEGRQPHKTSIAADRPTVKDVANAYLAYQLERANSAEITPRWFEDCLRTIQHFVRFAGSTRAVSDLRPSDFQEYRQKLASGGLTGRHSLGPYSLERSITVVKAMFGHAYETDLMDKPMKFGKVFERPSAGVKRRALKAGELRNGKRLFGTQDVRDLLEVSDIPLRSMILLGVNGGFGNMDCARLPMRAVDLDRAVIEFSRPKTGIDRTVPLWPETVDSLRRSLGLRPRPSVEEAKGLVFVTTFGRPWVRQRVHRNPDNGILKVTTVNSVRTEFDKILKRLSLKRKGLGFYALRHTFRTWADEVHDQHAIHRIMGHAIPGMSGIYVQRVGLERLRAVVDHVRAKLFGETALAVDSQNASAT